MSARVPDENGWYEIADNPLSKVGVFPYMGSMIDPNGTMGLDPAEVYNVYRSAEALSDPAAVDSFKLLPWIDDHQMLGQDSIFLTPPEEKGIDGVIGEKVYFDDGYLRANIKLFSSDLAEKIDSGKRELSCGFRCKYERKDGVFGDQKYSVVQTQIRGNHLASVDEGRMGPEVAVLDHLTFTIDSKDFAIMAKDPTLKEVLALDSIDAAGMAGLRKLVAIALDEDDANKNLAEDGDDDKAEDEDDANKNMAEDGDDDTAEDMDDDKAEDGDDDKGEDGDDDKGAGMDSLRAEVASLSRSVGKSTKRVMQEIRQRDKLAAQVSEHVGTFDHDDMTLDEVATYACDALELDASKGSELATLKGFFHNRRPVVAFGEDAANLAPQSGGVVGDYFKKG